MIFSVTFCDFSDSLQHFCVIFQKFLGNLVIFVCDFKKRVRRKISDLPLDKKHVKTDVFVDALVPRFIETGRLVFKRAFPNKKGRFLKTKWAFSFPTHLRRNKPVTELAGSAPAQSA